jgi:hypothetical protein
MRLRSLLLPVVCLVALALAPVSAHAKPIIGYGDQGAQMFSDPLFTNLKLRDARLTVEWDTFMFPQKIAQVDAWMAGARAAHVRPLVVIGRSWTPGRGRIAPTAGQYTTLVKTLRARYPQVRSFSPWNEANHRFQPTAHKPALAARYWQLMRQACRGCTVTSPVFLDLWTKQSYRWLAAFKKAAHNKVRLWAIQGYSDLNRGNDRHLASLVRQLPGKVWVTEAGGWVVFGRGWKYNEARAARAITYTFKLVHKYSRKIQRWYFYQWRGTPRGTKWDTGLIGRNGRPRPGYYAFARGLRTL